ncbi:hypothetical protein SOVF_167740 [Spinacia oleracea]|uniref:Small nuclear ribonucleoprotein-associated protein n=1 Tax=Spinacia oleracea TaxID=3562 RepID=A0A9R0IH08_SPIOL|nr:uncharacterized protein LOC110788632 [Spinacia oleracea]KNA07885.1 hypothetical protein SOVF_167740 [Spinacia oleracea]
MSMSKSSKMLHFVNYRIRITIQDERQLVGNFMGYDRHMNLVLGDCEEFRKKLSSSKGTKSKKTNPNEETEDHRTLGLLILRGEEVISMTVVGPPPPQESRSKSMSAAAMAGPGLGRATGRGIPTAPLVQAQPGLACPIRGGVGGPAPGMMQPQIYRPPVPTPQLSASAPVIRPPSQQMPGFPPQMRPPPQMPPPGHYLMPPQYSQRPRVPMPPPPMMRGPPAPGGQVPNYGHPRPGMPTPPSHPPNQP